MENMFIIDSMEVVTGWSARANTSGVARTTNHAMGQYAVAFDKSGTDIESGSIGKTIDFNLHLWKPCDHVCFAMYVSDATDVSNIHLILGTDALNASYWSWPVTDLTAGRFTLLSAKLGDASVLKAGVNMRQVLYLAVVCELNDAGDTLTDIAVDQIYLRRARFTQT